MRVLGFGTYDVDRHPRIGIILDGLRALGAEVTEANAPLGLDTAERIAMVNRPWLAYRLLVRLARCWRDLTRQARAARGDPGQGPIDAVVVGYLGQFDVLLARLLFPRTTIVLDALVFGADTAADRGLGRAGGLRRRALGLLDVAATAAATIVVVDTVENRDLIARRHRDKAVVVAVGAAQLWLRAGEQRAASTPSAPLRVVFFGLFTPLQGADVIAGAIAALAARRDIHITMIGTGQQRDLAGSIAAGNASVQWLDWVAPDELPALVAANDVCLGIFGVGAKAGRVVPNKVFQGAAAGCAIITSDTGPQRRALGSAGLFVAAGNADALADAVGRLADDRAEASRLGAAARARALEQFTAATVVAPLYERLQRA